MIENFDLPQELLGYYLNPIGDIDYDNDVRENPDGTYIKLGEKVYSQEIINGYFKPNSDNEIVTFNLKMMFPDYGNNQDYNKGATFNGKIVITEKEGYNVITDSWDEIATNIRNGNGEIYPVGSQKRS